MAEQREARIVVGKADGQGRHEILCHDPVTGRDVKTGLAVGRDQVESNVRQLKETLERAGNRVTVKEV
jgi:hypothetical protein